MGNKILKLIWKAWEKACRGEPTVFMTLLFAVLVILILAIRNGGFRLWFSYGTIFAVMWTRYLTMWIDNSHKNRKTQ